MPNLKNLSMAKQAQKDLVDCKQCESSDTEPINGMVPCRNKERNPKGFKVGAWAKRCDYYKERQS